MKEWVKELAAKLGVLNFIRQTLRRSRALSELRGWSAVDQKRFQFYSQFVGPNSIVFDVGANIGNRTKIFERLGAKVFAFEPQPFCSEILKTHFGRSSRVVVVPKAIGATLGHVDLHLNVSDTIASMSHYFMQRTEETKRFKGTKWDGVVSVPVVTLDSIISTSVSRPDFIKIDVEGYELEVLKGLSSGPKALSFEFTPELSDLSSQCIDKILTLGEYEFQLSLYEGLVWALPAWTDGMSLKKALGSVPKEAFGDVYARLKS
jgi:FkbM family methyltransferase